jgi:hypothetical protein
VKRTTASCPVLTYHSQIVTGNGYTSNDHIALASDLRLINELDLCVIPLSWLVEWLLHERELDITNCVCISFDDGADSDVVDLDFPGFGMQRSFLNIMADFQIDFGVLAQPSLHATAFVIASPDARAAMDKHSLFDRGWMNETWWTGACESGLMALGNHSWDHEHPDLAHTGGKPSGNFFCVDTKEKADRQIVDAGDYIANTTDGNRPGLFAYPYGHVSSYLGNEYFPGPDNHSIRAAFTTEPQTVNAYSDHWQLGRFVCGHHWRSPAELTHILLS